MKQKLFIFLGIIVLIALLIGLNAASYVRKETAPDREAKPNRSTNNAGATGTRAFFDLLTETGRKTSRWQEPPAALSAAGPEKVSTFVIVGPLPREIDDDEATQLLSWVSGGGRLVVIDREPPKNLVTTTANFTLSVRPGSRPPPETDPSDERQMTANTPALKPLQPSVYTRNINAVQPSRFASAIDFERVPDQAVTERSAAPTGDEEFGVMGKRAPLPTDSAPNDPSGTGASAPPPEAMTESAAADEPVALAPVAHLAGDDKTVLTEVAFGRGSIVYLTDPFIVSNGGIGLVDNVQLGVNLVDRGDGVIAFDEFHHGYGANENRLLQYFAGTPVIAIFLQLALLVGLILLSQSRRFARPLPAAEPDRLSKLEYVTAMAELQQRTRAFDLAMENIYTDFRRRAARTVGVDNFAVTRKELARLIAERLNTDEFEICDLMRECEEIIHGEPTNKKKILELTGRLREIERQLGLRRESKRALKK